MPTAIAICLGACAGALLRWRLGLWLNQPGGWLPWGTLVANLLGAYAIGIAVALFAHHPGIETSWRPLLMTGFLGALITFSSFSAETLDMLLGQRHAAAVTSVTLHLGGSLLLCWAGLRTVALWMKFSP